MSRVYLGFLDYSSLEDPSDVRLFLDREEYQRFHSYSRRWAGKGFLAGRILAKSMISNYLKYPVENIKFKLGPNGKPLYSGASFSISHSGSFAVCAVSEYPVGIDIEKWKRRRSIPFFASTYFYPDEASQVVDPVTDSINISTFYDLWVMKEAWLKCWGRTVWDMVGVPRMMETADGDSGYGFLISAEASYSTAVVCSRSLTGKDIHLSSEFPLPGVFFSGKRRLFGYCSNSKRGQEN